MSITWEIIHEELDNIHTMLGEVVSDLEEAGHDDTNTYEHALKAWGAIEDTITTITSERLEL